MAEEPKRLNAEEIARIAEKLREITEPIGLEAYPFKVGWYNESVQKAFHLNYNPDTIVFVVLSVPSMFEKCLIPFIKDDQYDCLSGQDPLDQCMKVIFEKVQNDFNDYTVTGIHDYEVHPNRRPKILVQTAGHVAGAAYYYRQEDIKSLDVTEKLYGVSIHPRYGGWFAFRGVLILKNAIFPALMRKDPEDVVKTDELKLELLRRFNHNWKDWSYRDIITPVSKYSEEQRLFFKTAPAERKALIETFKNKQ